MRPNLEKQKRLRVNLKKLTGSLSLVIVNLDVTYAMALKVYIIALLLVCFITLCCVTTLNRWLFTLPILNCDQELQATEKLQHFVVESPTGEFDTTTSGKRLMTWFTTFKETTAREVIQQSTLVNRGQFLTSNIQPVLFVTNTTRSYEHLARANGWHVRDVPRSNQFGSPFISDMIEVITSSPYQNSIFFGFANGDILFDESLVTTLKSIAGILASNKHDSSKNLTTPVLIVGRRTDSHIGGNATELISDMFYVEQLRRIGKLHAISSADYFIFTADFPWHLFDGLVIARPGYDNYILLATNERRMNVIDATKTLTAVHLETPHEGLAELGEHRWGTSKDDINYNREKLKGYNFADGVITLTPYVTDIDVNCLCLIVQERKKTMS